MDMPVGFTVNPLSDACGAEIIGLDLSQPQPQQVIDELRRLWNEYIVLVWRDQDFTEEEQLAFATRFGVARRMPGGCHAMWKGHGNHSAMSLPHCMVSVGQNQTG